MFLIKTNKHTYKLVSLTLCVVNNKKRNKYLHENVCRSQYKRAKLRKFEVSVILMAGSHASGEDGCWSGD